jgi:selenocysteine-specific elongation factor
MLRLVVGTAGHIDHGKTRLLEALTGVDCDRLAEEKARGITIDLGFTHLSEGEVEVGFVDVPGHEKFLHNALAGLGGIRLAMLVVSAVEGVMPQTREHLAICRLLGIPQAIVALTKVDLVDAEARLLARLEVGDLLAGTPYAEAPILEISSVTGEGIEELRQLLVAKARELALAEDPSQPARLPIDRSFQLRGLGVVVTGSLAAGRVESGQALIALPAGKAVKVRGIEVHGKTRQRADAGERTALQLGGVEVGELQRGDQLALEGSFAPTKVLCAELELLPESTPLAGVLQVRLHLLASEVAARLRPLEGVIPPGGKGPVEIRPAQPIVAVRGDRFIVRRLSPAETIGGGTIYDAHWRRRRGKGLEAALAKVRGSRQAALELWVAEGAEKGASAEELAPRLGERPAKIAEELAAMVAAGKLLQVESGRSKRYLDPKVLRRLTEKAKNSLKSYFRDNRLARGMPKAELQSRILPVRAQELGATYLGLLQAMKVLVLDGELVNLPGRSAVGELTGEETSLAQKVLDYVEGFGLTPPSPAEIADKLHAKPQILEGIQKFLVQQGKLKRLANGFVLSAAAIKKLREDLVETGWERFSVPQFKDRFGLSRKWAIPLLEHLDAVGATRRYGDERQVVRRG